MGTQFGADVADGEERPADVAEQDDVHLLAVIAAAAPDDAVVAAQEAEPGMVAAAHASMLLKLGQRYRERDLGYWHSAPSSSKSL